MPAMTRFPVPATLTAVFLDGGVPTVIVDPCAEGLFTGIVVVDKSSVPGTGVVSWGVGADPGAHTVDQLRLLETPAGWHPHAGIKDVITEWLPDHSYWAIATTTDVGHHDVGVTFKLADLASLAAGEVWAATPPMGNERAMPRTDFHTSAAASC